VSISIYYANVRKGSLLLAAVAVVAAGCGSSSSDGTTTRADNAAVDRSAARFVVKLQAQLKRGQFALAWRTLHPAEKRVVSAQKLASCYPKNQFPGSVTFRATKTRDVRWLVPGTKDSVDAKAVTVTATPSRGSKQTFEQHLVRRGGGWVWMLSTQYFDAARSGGC
jgi:hypothetical protein